MLANVGGGQYRGGTYQVLPYSLLDDGLLDVCVSRYGSGRYPGGTQDAATQLSGARQTRVKSGRGFYDDYLAASGAPEAGTGRGDAG